MKAFSIFTRHNLVILAFIVILGAFGLIPLHFAVVISSHRNTIKTLIQELALLKEEFERPDLGNEPSESRIQ